ncbi:MAG: HD domain-containing protein [Candidatus Aminicenantes bacterium]|nr:HD domain-containing protein [Candidatus Aminicenantes bacterium]
MNKNNPSKMNEVNYLEINFVPLLYLIDGEKKRAKQLEDFLSSQGFEVRLPSSPLDLFKLNPEKKNFLIIIWTVNHLKNFWPEVITKARKIFGHLTLILVAPPNPSQKIIQLIKEGLVNQVVSLDHWPALLAAVQNEIQKESLKRQLAQKKIELRQINLIRQKTINRMEELQGIYNATLENLMTALDMRDVETFGHSKIVARYCLALARLLGINDRKHLNYIHQGALLHDVGKIAIPDSILKKPDRLTGAEWEKIRLHPTVGYGLIKEINLDQTVGHIVLYHHERYDGSGYPFGLKNNRIPIEARIFALADALDAITSYRPYRQPRSFEAAKKEIIAAKGHQFDPAIVNAFCSIELKEWEKIRFETTKVLPAFDNLAFLDQD